MDGLNGFSEAIQGVFTRAVVRCIVHMVRTSLKFVSGRTTRQFAKDCVRLPAG
ncbi:MAG: transposase [Flavobacteriales bacterium]|nr:MAG: transposase [Flavobacteriales bacterium]